MPPAPTSAETETDESTLPQGVASGDLTHDSVVIWTRSTIVGDVEITLLSITDTEVTVAGTQTLTVTDTEVPVKTEFTGLEPGTRYIYRVTDAAGTIAWGRFETPPDEGYNGMHFGVTGDWRGDMAPFSAIKNMDDALLDFAILLGDTIYADFDSPAGPPTTDLDELRIKFQEVYGATAGENFFAELKASTPVYVMIDDHEVMNDFSGGAPAGSDDRFPEDTGLINDTEAYENGLQAFIEYHPIEVETYSGTGDADVDGEYMLYRTQSFGQDGAIFVLDQRTFRDEQIPSALGEFDPEVVAEFNEASFDPTRTLLGDVQLDQLKADLLQAEADGVIWKFVMTPEPIQDLGLLNGDSWEGYKAERAELLQFIEENDIDNVVFIAADIHGTFVNNLTYATEPGGEQIASSAFEITTGSVGYGAPFGDTVIDLAIERGKLPPIVKWIFDLLPTAPDADDLINDKDDLFTFALETLTILPNGLDPLGLDDNLPEADGLIDAELLQGGYVSAFTLGWTEFEVDEDTHALTVTTWGLPGYSPEFAALFPELVAQLEPVIVSQFIVYPELDPEIVAVLPGFQSLEAIAVPEDFTFEIGETPFTVAGITAYDPEDDSLSFDDFAFTDLAGIGTQPFDSDTLFYAETDTGILLFGSNDGHTVLARVDVEDLTDEDWLDDLLAGIDLGEDLLIA